MINLCSTHSMLARWDVGPRRENERTFTRGYQPKLMFLHVCSKFQRSDGVIQVPRKGHERAADSDVTKNSFRSATEEKTGEVLTSQNVSRQPNSRHLLKCSKPVYGVASETIRSRICGARERVLRNASGVEGNHHAKLAQASAGERDGRLTLETLCISRLDPTSHSEGFVYGCVDTCTL